MFCLMPFLGSVSPFRESFPFDTRENTINRDNRNNQTNPIRLTLPMLITLKYSVKNRINAN